MRAIEQDEAAILEERQAWPETIAGIAVERFVFLDESAARTDLVRSHGWSPCGERAPGTAPCGHWERVTILGALGPEGIVAAMSIPAATDGAVFCAWLEQVLLPELRRIRPDAVLVMDNLAAYKTKAVNGLLRKAAARTVDGLHAALGPALAAITKDDARGFFRHAGYACPN